MNKFQFRILKLKDEQPEFTKKWMQFVVTFLIFMVKSGCISASKDGLTPTVEVKSTVYPEVTLTATSANKGESNRVKILQQGETTLRTRVNEIDPSTYFDLDTGNQVLSDTQKADIAFQGSAGTMVFYFLMPVNTALIYYGKGDSVSYDYCLRALSSFTKGSVPEFSDGKPMCVLTNENHLAMVTYNPDSIHQDHNGEATIRVSFVVWDPVVSPK